MSANSTSRQTGFTIVELLIVIVVIGVLAAITVVAYSGIQERANNTAVIAAAKQVQQIITAYKTTNGSLPVAYNACLTTDNSCTTYTGVEQTNDNNALMTELRKIGTPPSSVPGTNPTYHGLYYNYYSPRTYNGNVAPALLMYWLKGEQQDCQLANVGRQLPGTATEINPYETSTTGYTSSGNGITNCWVSL